MESVSINIDSGITESHNNDNGQNSFHRRNRSYQNQYRCIYCVYFIKWLPVLLIFSLLTWSEYAFVRHVCFRFVNNNFERVIFLILHHIFLIMLIWSYSKTVFTKIPKVPQEFMLPSNRLSVYLNSDSEVERKQILEEFAQSLPNVNKTRDGCVRFCAFCNIIKPDRAHHCRMCGYCILKMDHHCPWVNTCICYFNYKYFILFLGYSLIYCLFIMAASLTYFLQQWTLLARVQNSGNIQLILLFLIALVLLISILSLFSYHCYLIIKNRTTLEAFRAPIFENGANKNGFNLGIYENFKQVFGNDPKFWCLPVCTK